MTPARPAAPHPARPARRRILRRSARGALLLAVVTLAVGGVVPAPSAEAAGYTVWSCRGPEGEPRSTAGWAGGGAGTRSDDCATGGSLRVRLAASDTAADVTGGYRFVLPPGVVMGGWRVWMSASVTRTTTNSRYDAGVAETDGIAVQGFTAGCVAAPEGCAWGDPRDPLAAGNLVEASGPAGGLAVAARCDGEADCVPVDDPAAEVQLHRSAVDIVDDAAPTVGPLGGDLVSGAPVDRPATVVAPVADAGGGVARVELLVDGAVAQVAVSGGGCRVPYETAFPCPSATDRAFTVDPAGLAAGPHALAVRVTDAAGNVAEGGAATFVVGERPTQAGPPGSPSAPGTTPSTGGSGTSRALVLDLPDRVSLPERRRTTGRARWAGGASAAGVRLDVLAGAVGGSVARMHRIGRVTVRADGTFKLPRTTESRTLRVVPTQDDLVARPGDVDLVAPLRVALRVPSGVVRNGRTATLRGTVAGAGDAAPDLQVLIQTIVRGRWATVDAVEPGRTGNVVWRYRFQRTVNRSAYRFRLVVPPTKGRPWKRTVSAKRVVRVDP
ncbi:hypothetical protein [Patulibacter americanus]|uniref:hypothetical protein n=1 Tax=Patulibacter americanus TaxID=588672 RepID=UPI0003B43BA1|nr:hypothetical protein [Patulibacter americanus]